MATNTVLGFRYLIFKLLFPRICVRDTGGVVGCRGSTGFGETGVGGVVVSHIQELLLPKICRRGTDVGMLLSLGERQCYCFDGIVDSETPGDW